MKKLVIALFITAGLFSMKASAQSTMSAETKSGFSISDSASFKGKYKYEGLPFEYMEVTIKEGKLHYVGGEYSGFLISVTDKKDVFDANGVAVFTFARNGENKITDLKIDYEGQSFQGKKEEDKKN